MVARLVEDGDERLAHRVEVRRLDLQDLSSIRDFAEGFTLSGDRVDVLVNNAGIMAVPYALTEANGHHPEPVTLEVLAAKAEARGAGAAQLGLGRGEYVLATVHRQENTDDPVRLAAIMGGLALVAAELPVLLPLHPRTRARAEAANMADALAALHIVEPVGYLGMTGLEKDAAVIATDSGGVQKEAFFHGVPCVTLRDETEWGELVEAGWNSLIPPGDAGTIRDAILAARGTRGAEITPYGTGNAADIIAAEIAKALS